MSEGTSKSWRISGRTFGDAADLHVDENAICPGREKASPWVLTVGVGPSRPHRIASRDVKGESDDGLFESRPLRQSQQPEISLPRFGRQKNALFQKGLPERPATALPTRRSFSFSFRPVSPEGRDLANLVTASGIVSYQRLEG